MKIILLLLTLFCLPMQAQFIATKMNAGAGGVANLGNVDVTQGGITNTGGNYFQLNLANGAQFLLGTNGHFLIVDQYGSTNEYYTNGFWTVIQTNGQSVTFSNGNLTISGVFTGNGGGLTNLGASSQTPWNQDINGNAKRASNFVAITTAITNSGSLDVGGGKAVIDSGGALRFNNSGASGAGQLYDTANVLSVDVTSRALLSTNAGAVQRLLDFSGSNAVFNFAIWQTNVSGSNFVAGVTELQGTLSVSNANGTTGVQVLTNGNLKFSGTATGAGLTINGGITVNSISSDSGNVTTDGAGDFTALTLAGDGSAVTNLNATNLKSGTVPTARLPSLASAYPAALTNNQTGPVEWFGDANKTNGFTYDVNGMTLTNGVGTNRVSGKGFDGNGGLLTNLSGGSITGALAAVSGANLTSLNGSQVTSGTVPNAQLPSNVATNNGDNRFSAVQTFSGNLLVTNATLTVSNGATVPLTIAANPGTVATINFTNSGAGNGQGLILAIAGQGRKGLQLESGNNINGVQVFSSGVEKMSMQEGAFGVVVGTNLATSATTTHGLEVQGSDALIRTNVAPFDFTPANPGQWASTLGTRYTNTLRRATLELDLGFTTTLTVNATAKVVIEQGSVITNTWFASMQGGISDTQTNHYSYRLTTNAVVTITDVSGAGASVALSQNQIVGE